MEGNGKELKEQQSNSMIEDAFDDSKERFEIDIESKGDHLETNSNQANRRRRRHVRLGLLCCALAGIFFALFFLLPRKETMSPEDALQPGEETLQPGEETLQPREETMPRNETRTEHSPREETMSHNETMKEPSWTDWPIHSVKIFTDTDDLETSLNELKSIEDGWNATNSTFTSEYHFSQRRNVVFFAPGSYTGLEFQVGYYTQVAGLGATPDQVRFQGGGPFVNALDGHLIPGGTSLNTFWRSLENVATDQLQWAVSQAAPLRNVVVLGDLILHDKGAYASGGFMANAEVRGSTYFGGQQQWFSRNVHFGDTVVGGAWSLVYAGCTGNVPEASNGTQSSAAHTVIEKAPLRLEKPFITLREDNLGFQLRVPPVQFGEKTVGSYEGETTIIDFEYVRVVRDDEKDPTSRIQEAFDQGKHVVLAPGIFHLTKTIEIHNPHQVFLGLGYATLVVSHGGPAIHVATNTPGVRIAGIMLEALAATSALLEWGDAGTIDPGTREEPGGLSDVFCRVGGAESTGNRSAISVETMIRIHSGNVVGDNVWLWRADHAHLREGEAPNYPDISTVFHQTEENEYQVGTGIEVLGNDVSMFGLFVEHANGHQTVWKGERGLVVFYQCELPYGVLEDFGEKGYRGYLVHHSVQEHEVFAPGVYSNFRNAIVNVTTAMEIPTGDRVIAHNPFTVHLDNNGLIQSVINGKGDPADTQGLPMRVN